jgi:hypothetical protein
MGCPASATATEQGIVSISSAGAYNDAKAVAWWFSGADLVFALRGNTLADARIATVSGFIASPSAGHNGILGIRRTGTTLTLAWDGAALAYDTTTSGSNPPAWSGDITGPYLDVGTLGTAGYLLAGDVGSVCILNRYVSDVELATITETGRIPASDFPATPAGTDQVTDGDFSSAAGWNVGSAWSIAGGVATIIDIPDGGAGTELTQTNKVWEKGESVLVTYTLAGRTSGASNVIFVGYGAAGSTTPRTADGTYAEIVTLTENATSFLLAGKTITQPLNIGATIDDLSIVSLGAVFAMDSDQPGYGSTWRDVSGWGADLTIASGVKWGRPASGKLDLDTLNVAAVAEYADNAAAVAAGLPVGRLYRTGDTLKIVHA